MDMRELDPSTLWAPNATNPRKVAGIMRSLKAQGRQGRPLLVEEARLGSTVAWTGRTPHQGGVSAASPHRALPHHHSR